MLLRGPGSPGEGLGVGVQGGFRGTFSIQATHCKLEDNDYLTAQTLVEQSGKINVRNQWSNMT